MTQLLTAEKTAEARVQAQRAQVAAQELRLRHTSVIAPDEGSILLDGQAIHGRRPSAIAALGMSRTFQNIRLFQSMTVLENVKLARHMRKRQGLLDAILRTPALQDEEREVEADALELLKIFHLDDRAHELAKNLPYGSQRRLEIARALATKPKVLLLAPASLPGTDCIE